MNIYLLIGSERGFCGDFNEALMRAFEIHSPTIREKSSVVVGAKLGGQTGSRRAARAAIDGASVVEEVDAVLD